MLVLGSGPKNTSNIILGITTHFVVKVFLNNFSRVINAEAT